MSRRRTGRRSSRVVTAVCAFVVILLGGAVWNSGGARAVSWAIGVSVVATLVHLLIGKKSRRRGRSRTRSRSYR
jgi:uncharacterized membrane protein YfcA